jgi:hypothetical protein
MARGRLAALLLLAVAARVAIAQPGETERSDEGLFVGPGYRWGEMPLAQRVLRDVVAIPAGVGRWDAGDWLRLGIVGGSVAVLWLGADPSPDVRLDRWTRDHVNPHLPKVWTRTLEFTLWPVLVGGVLATWAWADLNDRPRLAQGLSLLAESVIVFHVYHVTLKVLIGREGPSGLGEGRVLGPFQALGSFPSGTPSGHAGTLYASIGATFAYFDPPAWVQVLGHVAVATLTVLNVVDHGHYASEVVWGGAMGWYTARWVVAHRSSAGASRERAGPRVVPVPLERGLGVALVAPL